jgi:hypothetical protein
MIVSAAAVITRELGPAAAIDVLTMAAEVLERRESMC